MTIIIKTGNAAFTGTRSYEVARILRDLADRLDNCDVQYPADGDHIPLYDINGNNVGKMCP